MVKKNNNSLKKESRRSAGNETFLHKHWPVLTGGALIIALVASYFIFPTFHDGVNKAFDVITSNDRERIREWVKTFGILGPLVLILAMTVQMFMLVIPNILLFVIAVICYGPVWGTVICLVGVFCSSSLGYWIGRKLGPRAIDRFVGQTMQDKIQIFIERYGVKAVAIFRLSSLSTDSLGFVAGILEMNYKRYILATLVGITPVIILIAIYGTKGNFETALLWIAGIAMALLGVYIFLDRKRRQSAYETKRRSSEASPATLNTGAKSRAAGAGK